MLLIRVSCIFTKQTWSIMLFCNVIHICFICGLKKFLKKKIQVEEWRLFFWFKYVFFMQNMARADIKMEIRNEDSAAAGGRADDEGPLIKYYRASEALPGAVPVLHSLLRKGPATCAVTQTTIFWRLWALHLLTFTSALVKENMDWNVCQNKKVFSQALYI